MSTPKTGTMAEWLAVTPSGKFFTVTDSPIMPHEYGTRLDADSGNRYVRGPHMITEARNMGWNDLADWIESQGYKDVEE